MAITINGTGTITGLTAGGLPDGSVTTDDLAADAVTSAKIASGTIVDADVNASAAIADSKLTGTTCKAWVNFDGTLVTNPGSATGIRASYNVSSITDNGVGDYTVNFTTAMVDANYSFALSKSEAASEPSGYNATISTIGMTTTGINVRIRYNNGVIGDDDYVSVAIFR
jgi:hypothetical protein